MTFGSLSSATEGKFSVSISSRNDPVGAGSDLSLDVLVENTDAEDGEKTIELYVDGEVVDTKTVAIEGGGSKTVTLNWDTSSETISTYNVEVKSPDSSFSTTVEIVENDFFIPYIWKTNSPVSQGDNLNVEVLVYNIGELNNTKTVTLSQNGTQEDSQSITLDGGAITSTVLTWATKDGDAGTPTIEVDVVDDSVTKTIEIESIPLPESTLYNYDVQKMTASDGEVIGTIPDNYSGHDLTAGIEPTYITSNQNGYPVIEFNGTDTYVNHSKATLTRPFTTFYVYRYTGSESTGSARAIVDSADSNERVLFYARNKDTFSMYGGDNTVNIVPLDNDEYHIMTIEWHDSDSATARYDGTTKESDVYVGVNDMPGITIGRNAPGDQEGPFRLAQFVGVDGSMALTEIEDLESSIADNWGITL